MFVDLILSLLYFVAGNEEGRSRVICRNIATQVSIGDFSEGQSEGMADTFARLVGMSEVNTSLIISDKAARFCQWLPEVLHKLECASKHHRTRARG